jgi:hypothetical protein
MANKPRTTTTRTAAAKAKAAAAESAKAVVEAVETPVTTETEQPTPTVPAEDKTEVPAVQNEEAPEQENPPSEPEPQPEPKVEEPVTETKVQTVAELEATDQVIAKVEQVVVPGITLVGKATDVLTPNVRNETLEGFIKSKYKLDPEQYTPTLKRTIRGFEQYHKNMNARCPVTLEEAAKHQMAWYRTVTGALDSQVGDSTMCFDVILHLANRHSDDLFTDRLACRAFNLLNDGIRDQFNLFQTIIVNAANPRKRSTYFSKSISLPGIERTVTSQNQRTNLLAYISQAI